MSTSESFTPVYSRPFEIPRHQETHSRPAAGGRGFRWTIHTLFLIIWTAAVIPGLWAVRDIHWPHDLDGYRDIAAAQAMRDGHWFADPFYKDEAAWYSPAVPAVVALVSTMCQIPVSRTFIVLGPLLNALAPIAFYVCLWRLVGGLSALAAVSAFLFLPGRPPAWEAGTFTPWLFPAVTAQAFFYVGIVTWMAVQERWRPRTVVLFGLLLGGAFLTHPASALMLGGIMLVTLAAPAMWPDAEARRRRVLILAIACAVALIAAAPFWLPIAFRYGFHTMNRAPAIWVYEAIEPDRLLTSFFKLSALLTGAIAAAGLWALWRYRARRAFAIVVAWAMAGSGLFVYALAAERMTDLPPLVSAYHFYLQLRALKWLLFGVGFAGVAGFMMLMPSRRFRALASRPWAVGIVPLLMVAALYPRYVGREAFTGYRAAALAATAQQDVNRARAWIRAYTSAQSVFLASDIDGLRLVGPAGRHVVCVERFFSNPYVSYEARAAARDRMITALTAGDRDAFEIEATSYGVTHALVSASQALAIQANAGDWTRVAFSTRTLVVLQVRHR